MSIDNFYSDVPIHIWQKVLDENMHYHFGINHKNDNPFEVAVKILYKFIEPNSTILDCGCGWGAPARMLMKDLNCTVDGVTISKQQYNYIKDFQVYHEDLHNFIPTKNYNTALFLETYTHLSDPSTVINNFYPYIDSIIIKDYSSDFSYSIPDWNMKIRTKNDYYNIIENSNYKILYCKEYKNVVYPSVYYWFNNIKKLKQNEIYGQIKKLYDLCKYCINTKQEDNNLKGIIIHAVKNK